MMFTFCILMILMCLTRGGATPDAVPRATSIASPEADPFHRTYSGYPIPGQYYPSSIGQHRFNSPYSGMSPYPLLRDYNFYSPNMQHAFHTPNPQGVADRTWSSDLQRYHQLHGFADEVPGRSIYDYRNTLNNGVRNTRAMSSNFRIPNLSVLRTPLKTKTSQINAIHDLIGQASVPFPVIMNPSGVSALSTVREGVPLPTSDFSSIQLSDVLSKRTLIDDDLMSDNSPAITEDDLQPLQSRNVKGFPHIIIIPPDIAFGNQVPVLSHPQPIESTLRINEMSTALSMPQHLLSTSNLNGRPAKLETPQNLLSTSGLNGLSASLSTPQNSLMAQGGNSLQSIQSLAARSKFPTVINYLPININTNPQPRMQERGKFPILDEPEDLGEIDTNSNNNILSSILEIISQQKVQRRKEDNFNLNRDIELSGNSNNDISNNNFLASILNKLLQQHNPRRNSEDFNLNRANSFSQIEMPLPSSPSQQKEPISSSSESIKSRQGVPLFSSSQKQTLLPSVSKAIRNRQGIPLSMSSSQQGVPIPSASKPIDNQQGIPLSFSSSQQGVPLPSISNSIENQQGVPLSSVNQQVVPLPSSSNSIESQQGVPSPSISEVIEIQQEIPVSSVGQQRVHLSSISRPIVSQQAILLSPSTEQERSLSSSSEPMQSQMISSPKRKYSKQKMPPSSSGENIQSRKGMPLPSVINSIQNQQGMSLSSFEQGITPPSEIMLPPPKPLPDNEPLQSQRISSLEEKISELTEIIKGLKVQSTSPPRRKLYLIKV